MLFHLTKFAAVNLLRNLASCNNLATSPGANCHAAFFTLFKGLKRHQLLWFRIPFVFHCLHLFTVKTRPQPPKKKFNFKFCLLFQLWPENPTYQVYVPGYHNAMPHQQHFNGGRARSVSPEAAMAAGMAIPSDHPRAHSRGGILYAELQFPVTSNYGSMKKRSQRDRAGAASNIPEAGTTSGNTTTTTSVNSGEPSPTHMIHDGLGSLDSVHRYVPDYVAIHRKTAV
jgi:hypothetical protein